MNAHIRYFLPFLTVCLLTACQPSVSTTQSADFETYLPIRMGEEKLQLRIALSDSEHARGLMYHDTLDLNHGMLFVFREAGRRSFWMRNTKIPLDLGYLDPSGKLIEIHALYPFDENNVASYSQNILMALEMNQGWFKANGVKRGDRLNLKQLKEALLARGVEPSNYPLSESE